MAVIHTLIGTSSDPIVGGKIGGVNVFGGGLALYDSSGTIIGGLGVSGDTSCRDHFVAWELRHVLKLDYVPGGVSGDANRPDQHHLRHTDLAGRSAIAGAGPEHGRVRPPEVHQHRQPCRFGSHQPRFSRFGALIVRTRERAAGGPLRKAAARLFRRRPFYPIPTTHPTPHTDLREARSRASGGDPHARRYRWRPANPTL